MDQSSIDTASDRPLTDIWTTFYLTSGRTPAPSPQPAGGSRQGFRYVATPVGSVVVAIVPIQRAEGPDDHRAPAPLDELPERERYNLLVRLRKASETTEHRWREALSDDLIPELVAQISVSRAAMGVPADDLSPTGPTQVPGAASRWQRVLDDHVGLPSPTLRHWTAVARQLAPQLRDDPETPGSSSFQRPAVHRGLRARS